MVILKERPVYLLAGTEQFLKEEALARIKSAFLDKESGDFNFNVFYAGSCAIKEILECASTAPFLGRKRVVLVRRIEDFSAADEKLILSYVSSPNRLTALILETSQNNFNEDFFAEICKYARVILCNPLTEEQLYGWIKGQVEAKGKKIEEQALQLLVDNLGSNLQALASSLDNFILYIGERETIALSDVEKLSGQGDATRSAFKLFDAVVVRDKEKSFQILDSLWKDGVSFPQILGALAHKIISERVRIGPSLLKRHLLDLQKTDSDIKTGRQGPKIALELLTARLLGLL
jgi:DNA polymerase-3 subunit delta